MYRGWGQTARQRLPFLKCTSRACVVFLGAVRRTKKKVRRSLASPSLKASWLNIVNFLFASIKITDRCIAYFAATRETHLAPSLHLLLSVCLRRVTAFPQFAFPLPNFAVSRADGLVKRELDFLIIEQRKKYINLLRRRVTWTWNGSTPI